MFWLWQGQLKMELFPKIALEKSGESGKIGYTRAARTDKGVSAVCQVVTLNCKEGLCTQKVKDKGGNESVVASKETLTYLNKMIPSDDIRVLHVTQTKEDFFFFFLPLSGGITTLIPKP